MTGESTVSGEETSDLRQLARFAHSVRVRDIDDRVLEAAAMVIASTIASAAAGRDLLSSSTVRRLARSHGGSGQSAIWFAETGDMSPVSVAARVNATMSSASASDSSDLRSMAHPGTPVVAAALAQGEAADSNGAEVLRSVVLGYEASNRIGGAVSPAYKQKGFHGSLVEIFGSALATALLLDGDEDGLTHGLSLSASSIGGLMAAANTSTNREYSVGLAAMLGVEAAEAAVAGFEGEEAVLEASGGFLDVYGSGASDFLLGELGSRWGLITDMAIKLMPGGVPHHAMAEAVGNAARALDVLPDDIEAILVSKQGLVEIPGPRHPTDLVEAAHSAAYFAAASAVDHSFTWEHASPEKLSDPAITSLLDRVEVGDFDESLTGKFQHAATVEVRSLEGASARETVLLPRGSIARGLQWEEVDEKFRVLTRPLGLGAERVERILDLCHELGNVPRVSELTSLLTH